MLHIVTRSVAVVCLCTAILGASKAQATTPSPPSSDHAAATASLSAAAAVAMVLDRNLELAALAKEAQADVLESRQAALPPNPELEVEMDNFWGDGEMASLSGAETTVSLSQTLLLGGKRQHRQAVAAGGAKEAQLRYRLRRLELAAAAREAVIAILTGQERLAMAGERLRLAEENLAAVSARVSAGKAPPLEETRARVAVATARVYQNKVERQLTTDRNRLAALWGAATADFQRIAGSLEPLPATPPLAELEAAVAEHPAVLLAAAAVATSRAQLALARADAMPDITFRAGLRRFGDSGEEAMVAGIALPLPLFNRNRDGIAAARHRLTAAEETLAAVRAEKLAELYQAWEELAAARIDAELYSEHMINAARQALEAARLGYRQGKFGYLDLLAAERNLFEVNDGHLTAIAAVSQATVAVTTAAGRLGNGAPQEQP